ncbi:MAG TPA: TraR/DksA C4-type zinc finger protein [Patescibacteria group bacterium]|nr:TraR/DksA C4-type zinc finger protein [Patescibacteria group bacterium]
MITIDEVKKAIHQEPMDLDTITKYLQEEKERLEDQISNMTEEDPFFQEDRDMENESITDAYEVSEHLRIDSISGKVQERLDQISRVLEKITEGTYGICDNCSEPIDKARLMAMPDAIECVKCERQGE